jgi:AraC-like DNA-binding protein
MPGHDDSCNLIAMQETLSPDPADRLEGLCQDAPGAAGRPARFCFGQGCDGIERLQARFRGRAFSPHRHDTYAIGITLAGVQTFHYRGEKRQCLPGQCHILHPDELHDGAAGTDDGFAYRILYIDPCLVQAALGGRPLPFVSDPVVDLTGQQKRSLLAAWDIESPIDDVVRVEIIAAVADTLRAACSDAARPLPALRLPGLLRVRSLISARPAERHSIAALERVADLDRWSLARQFRLAFGTSPSRFRTMRQLDQVRRLMTSGSALSPRQAVSAPLDLRGLDPDETGLDGVNLHGRNPPRLRPRKAPECANFAVTSIPP